MRSPSATTTASNNSCHWLMVAGKKQLALCCKLAHTANDEGANCLCFARFSSNYTFGQIVAPLLSLLLLLLCVCVLCLDDAHTALACCCCWSDRGNLPSLIMRSITRHMESTICALSLLEQLEQWKPLAPTGCNSMLAAAGSISASIISGCCCCWPSLLLVVVVVV